MNHYGCIPSDTDKFKIFRTVDQLIGCMREANMNKGYSIYNQIHYNTSDPLKIIVMLYDGAINYLHKAIEYNETGDIKNMNIF